MKHSIFILAIILFTSSCKSNLEDERIFPEVRNIVELANTDFVSTLESSFVAQKNIVYAATMPIAWNEIRNAIGGKRYDFSSAQLQEINETTSYENVLKENEYETSIEFDGLEIIAKAYFRKSLPFEEPLTKFDTPLEFNKSKVESFGFWGSSSMAKINYFHKENDFSISLFPENAEHEIILIMSNEKIKTFKKYFDRFNQEKHLKRKKAIHFNEDDKVEIPLIEFNLAKTFDEISGSNFTSDQRSFIITELFQRNAFVLNENGAEVESEVEFVVVESAEEIGEPKPKMMIFDKPFVVFLKRKDAENPYFGIYIANNELLKQIK